MMLPLTRYRNPTDPVLLGVDREISAGAFFRKVAELAEALPEAQYVINLAESRSAFMLGFAAALVRGRTSLLPPAQGRMDWQQLVGEYAGATILTDRTDIGSDVFDIEPYLAFDALSPPDKLCLDIPDGFAAAILFTSGSTGRPTAHKKSWGQLSRGAAHLAAALGQCKMHAGAVVGSVPSQHMFGLEATVMLPWHLGIPVHVNKPLLPADLESALRECGRPCIWVTTPMHLRAPINTTGALSAVSGIVASTMSLPRTIAAAAEMRWQVPVLEIYGSTETGALATRRTAQEEVWTPLRDVQLQRQTGPAGDEFFATGSHIHASVRLGDELCLQPDGRFLWLGRSGDMLKIGGKRASLAALNQWIAEVPGVDDAAYFVPDAGDDAPDHDAAHPARRLAAFFVSSTVSPKTLLTVLSTRIDPVFLPRPLLRVSSLPRDANGKLTQAALAALFSQERGSGREEKTTANDGTGEFSMVVAPDHPALSGHFPGNPIVPGVVILAHVAADIRCQLPAVTLRELRAMRFYQPLNPGQRFTVVVICKHGIVDFKVRLHDATVEPGGLVAAGQWACEDFAALDTIA